MSTVGSNAAFIMCERVKTRYNCVKPHGCLNDRILLRVVLARTVDDVIENSEAKSLREGRW